MNDRELVTIAASIIAAHNRFGSAAQAVVAARVLLAEVDRVRAERNETECVAPGTIHERPAPAEASSHASGTTPGKPPGSDVSPRKAWSPEALVEAALFALEAVSASPVDALTNHRGCGRELKSCDCTALNAGALIAAHVRQIRDALRGVAGEKHKAGDGSEVDHPPTPKVGAGSTPAPELSPFPIIENLARELVNRNEDQCTHDNSCGDVGGKHSWCWECTAETIRRVLGPAPLEGAIHG